MDKDDLSTNNINKLKQGPLIDSIAKEGDPEVVYFKRPFLDKGSWDFSFSGIKTGIDRKAHV